MVKHAFIAAISSFTVSLTSSAVLFAANVFEDITVLPDPGEGGSVAHGYIEHRCRITNRSRSRSHDVMLVMPNRSYSSEGLIRRITRQVTIAPGTEVVVSLFQLPLAVSGDGLVGVSVDGRSKGVVSMSAAGYGSSYYYNPSPDPHPRLLVSRSVSASDFEQNIASNYFGITTGVARLSSTFRRYGPPSPPASGSALGELWEPVRSELDPRQWKETWLAYSSFDGVVLTESDIKQMSQNAQLALLRYVECGGSLLVGGTFDIPRPWNKYPLPVANGLKGYNVGFGQCILSPTAPLNSLKKEQIQNVRQMWSKSLQPWRTFREQAQANEVFPVVDKVILPLRAFFIMMIAFTVVIGLDLFILYRIRKQIWMLWTVPLLSGVTAAIVIAYAFISEGITPTLRIESLTILDQLQHRATTLGMASYYCPITPWSGLHFGYNTEVTPLVGREWNSRRNSPSKTIDLSRDQYLESGWISARAPSVFMLRKNELRRERLEIKQINGGALSVVNGLGADIDGLWVTDKNGTVFSSGTSIPAGKQVALSPSARVYNTTCEINRLSQIYAAQDWYVAAICPNNDPSALLISGTYTAFLRSSPFIEKGLMRRSNEKLKSVVVGFWDAE